MKPEDRKRLKQHIEMIVEHKIPSNVVFCPNCEKDTECIHTAELYECKDCGEDFAKYIVSRKPANSDVSVTQDVLMDIKTGRSVENNNPDYYKAELARRDADIVTLNNRLTDAVTLNGELVEKVESRDEIIARLKEDAERLAMHAYYDEYEGLEAVSLHRALMTELNQTGELK